MTVNTQNKIILVIFILIDIFVIGLYCYLFQDLKAKNQSFSIIASEIQDEARQREELLTLKNIMKSIQEDRTRLNSYFITSDEIAVFLDSLEAMGKKVGTESEVTSIILAGEEKNVLEVSVKATGPFEDVFELLLLLEHVPYELDFQKISFGKIKVLGLEDVWIWEGNFTFHIISFIIN